MKKTFASPLIVAWMLVSLSGCSSIAKLSASSTPRIVIAAVTSTPALPADVVIRAMQYNRKVAIKVGQTLFVELPDGSAQWRIDFGIKHLNLLMPSNEINLPKENGWLLQAIAAGETQITLTSIVHCSDPQACPLMPRTFMLTIQVE